MNIVPALLAIGAPVAATLALWWASTGAALYLDARDRRTFGWTLAGASALGLGALGLSFALGPQTTPMAAGLGFSAGLVCWGWQLVAFYTGFVTGPRKSACEPNLKDFARFVEAARTGLYHEIASACGALALSALVHGQPNEVALWTYLILWAMHVSAKLNLFLGVPNHAEDLLPDHLAHLKSFMTNRPMNLLFPVSVTAAALIAFALARQAAEAANAFDATAGAMPATLMALAGLEHWFMVTPFEGNVLWRFTQRDRTSRTRLRARGEGFKVFGDVT